MKHDVVILAAGFGSRLKRLTKCNPKALINFKRKPILQIQLESLDYKLINKIIIVTGYKDYKIRNFVKKKFSNKEIIFVKNNTYKKNTSGQSFFFAYNYITTKSYIHINCDNLFTKKLFKKIIKSKKNIIAARSDLTMTNGMENINIRNKDSLINKMSLKISKYSKFKAFGLAKINLKTLSKINKHYKSLSQNQKLHVKYYDLIRYLINNKKDKFYILKTDKTQLHEINNQKDKKNCKLII
jgi:choline kinase